MEGGKVSGAAGREVDFWGEIDLRSPRRAAFHGSEHAFQASFVAELELRARSRPELSRIFAIPNGGQRNRVVAAKLKAEGVKAGVPDLFLAHPSGRFAGLFLEMKVAGGDVKPKQREWLIDLRRAGYRVAVVNDFKTAWRVVADYIGPKTSKGTP